MSIARRKRFFQIGTFIGLALLAFDPFSATALTGQYHFAKESRARIKVEIKTNIFSFTAETKDLSGNLSIVSNSPSSTKGELSAMLATLDTHMELRNRHMRENYLEVDRYPRVSFRLSSVTIGKDAVLKAGATVEGTYRGIFSLHGIEREIQGKGSLSVSDDEKSVTIKTKFPLKLSEFGIKQPSFKLVSVNDTIVIDLFAKGIADALNNEAQQ